MNEDRLPLGQRLKAMFDGVFETQEEAEEFHRYLEEQRKAGISRPLPEDELPANGEAQASQSTLSPFFTGRG